MNTTEAIAKLSALIAASPNNQNPTYHNGTCLYTGNDGTSHCIVGQLAADAGWDIPGPGEPDDYASGMVEKWGWPIDTDTADYFTAVQHIADGPVGSEPIPWGEIVLPDPAVVKAEAAEAARAADLY